MLLYDDALNLVANLLPDLLASVHHTVEGVVMCH
jgi:hypothetical protein